ncbi:MAG: flagellar biosynthetic protein FliO [Planctomycetes bacterium]|nr:flagellar biosynthetic protein FliO [Planctomycetota bacterium]
MAITLLSPPIGVVAGGDPLPTGPDLTRYLLVCGALIAAILVLAWGFRRLIASTTQRGLDRRGMKIVDMLPLGGKQRVAVVKCYDRTFVLGLGDKEVHLVGELDRESVPETSRSIVDGADFSKILSRLMGRTGQQAAATQDGGAR